MSTYGAYQDSLLGHVANQTTHHTTNHSKLEDIKTKLDSVISNTGDLELNTDTLEAKIQDTNDKLDRQNFVGSELRVVPRTAGFDDTQTNAISLANGTNHGVILNSHAELRVDDRLSRTQLIDVNTKLNTSNTNTSSIDGKITQGEGNITGGGNGLQQILIYGKDQSGNLDPINVDSNGHIKMTLNDIESGITSSIKVTNDNITKGADLTLTEAQQNLVYGVDAFNTSQLEPIRISSDKVMAETFIASVSSGIANALPVEDMRSWEAIATLDSALAVPNAGNNDSSIISNNKQTDKYIIQIQCDDNTYTDFNFEIMESIDASNFQKTIEVQQPMTPAFFIMESIDNLAPNWKVRVNNTGASAKNFTIKYVKA